MVGKYLNGYGIEDGFIEPCDAREIPPGWSRVVRAHRRHRPARYRYKLNENGSSATTSDGATNYVTDVLGSKVNQLRQAVGAQPEAVLPLVQPDRPARRGGPAVRVHAGPAARARATSAATGTSPLRGRPNFNEEDVSDKPDKVQDLPRLSDERSPTSTGATAAGSRACSRWTRRSKRIVGRVRKAGDKRKTYIFFTSDNGLQLGAHRLMFKYYLYEECDAGAADHPRPGHPGGRARPELVSNIDLAPTIAELTGASRAG